MNGERRRVMDALYEWAAQAAEREGKAAPVIWRGQDGPAPEGLFLSLEFLGSSTPGSPHYGMVEGGKRAITRPVRRALAMRAFGEGALELLEAVKASTEKDWCADLLAGRGIVIPYAEEARMMPQTRAGAESEEAAAFDFYVTHTRVAEDEPGWIDAAEITPRGDLPMAGVTI